MDALGARSGYVFKSGSAGVGYYRDGMPEDGDEGGEPATKRARVEAAGRAMAREMDGAALLEEAEAAAEEKGGVGGVVLDLDLHGLKALLLGFEKKINKNQRLRVKFADEPEKFLESECDLDDEVKNLYAVAASPDLYPQFVELGAVRSLLGLLSHENTDISISVIQLLLELMDPETAVEAEEEMGAFVDAIIKEQGLELLVQNLSRLDEVGARTSTRPLASFAPTTPPHTAPLHTPAPGFHRGCGRRARDTGHRRKPLRDSTPTLHNTLRKDRGPQVPAQAPQSAQIRREQALRLGGAEHPASV